MSLVGGRNQAVPIKLVARDENGNLDYIALIEENGTVLAQESCVPDMTAECTLVLTMVSPEGYGRRVVFFAVAVDKEDLRSEGIRFIVGTNVPTAGGAEPSQPLPIAGGAEPSQPVPTETPEPTPRPRRTANSQPTITLRVAQPDELEPFIVNITTTFQPRISYTGGRRLSYALIDGPEGMDIDSRYGTIAWTPQESDKGQTFDVTILVTDGDKYTEASFQVTVMEPESLVTEIDGNILRVTDTETTLEGLEVTSAPDETPLTTQELEELQESLAKAPRGSVPTIPSWITPISDVFVVTGTLENPVEVRFPLGDLPNGVSLNDINLYGYVESTEELGRQWSTILLDTSFEGTESAPIFVVELGGLAGLAFFGYHSTSPAIPFPTEINVALPLSREGSDHIFLSALDNNPSSARAVWIAETQVGSPYYSLVEMTFAIDHQGFQPYIPIVHQYLNAAPATHGDIGEQLPGETARSKGAAISVTPPSIDSITCEPQQWTILFFSGTDHDNIVCTYDADAEVEITVKGFGDGCRWGETDECDDTAATVEELAVWAITAQLAFESIGLGYDKDITVKLDRFPKGKFGSVQLRDPGTIHLSDDLHNEDRFIPYDKTVMKHYVFHEYLHHAQLHANTKLQNDSPLLIDFRGPTKWLAEGTADWFGDEVDDSLNPFDKIAGDGAPILEVGLNSPPDERDFRKRPYERFAFFKLLNEKCDDFPSHLKNLFNDRVEGSDSPDVTGIRNLARVLSEADCDFGDHLNKGGIDRSGSLEAALTYYNYATQSEDDIDLLDSVDEFNFDFDHSNLGFHPTPQGFGLVDGFGESTLAYFDPEGDLFRPEYLITVIPAAGAYSVNFPIVTPSDLPEGSVAELVVKPKGGELFVSIAPHGETGRSDDFIPTNTIGPEDDSEPHTWFSTEESTTYLFSEARIPQVFVTVANASLTADIEVEILLRIRRRDDDQPAQPDTTTGDRAALVTLYNDTDGPNWTKKNNWLSDDPISSWHGVSTDSEGRVTALFLENNGLAGEIPSELGRLNKLRRLYLGGNDLTGEIPFLLNSLSELEVLDLNGSQLSGRIPPLLGSLTKLTTLRLSDNQLMGHIPSSLGNLRKLRQLHLAGNPFKGCIRPQLKRVSANDLANLNLPDCQHQAFARNPDEDVGGLQANGNPTDVWSNADTLWVLDRYDEKIYAYDIDSKNRVPDQDFDTLYAAGNRSPEGIWSDGETMWVSDLIDERLYAYDLATKTRVPSKDFDALEAAENDDPQGIWSDGDTMWVVDRDDDKLYAYDMATKARVPGKDFNSLDSENDTPKDIWSDEVTMWVAELSGTLFAYDLTTRARIPARDFVFLDSDRIFPQGIWSDGDTMWVVDEQANQLYAFDPGTRNRVSDREFSTYNAAGNEDPRGIWSDGDTIWVADDHEDGTLFAYDLNTKARVTSRDFNTLAAAENKDPRGVWSDGVTMWVSDDSEGKIYAYDLTTKVRTPGRDFNTLDSAGNDSPTVIWSDGVTMWVADRNDIKLYAYDMATKDRVPDEDFNTLAGAGNDSPSGIWSDGVTIWVADDRDERLYAYDMKTKARLPARYFNTLASAENDDPQGIWSDGNSMWVVDGDDGIIYAYHMP